MKTTFGFCRKRVYLIMLSVLLVISFGCGVKNTNRGASLSDGKLVADKDGYIYLTCDEFWQLMNGDIFKQNFLKMSNYEFGSEYDGSLFAITGTLKYSNAFNSLHLYNGDRGVVGGSQFDYSSVLDKLGVSKDRDYDGKNVVIKLTLKEGDIVKDDLRAYPSVTEYSIEVVK